MNTNEHVFLLWGWTLFMLSALFFIAASIRSGDWISLIGSLLFLAANIIFLIPLLTRTESNTTGKPVA